MNRSKWVATAFVVLAFTGCKEIEIENGQIPSKYVPMAQKYAGTYRGEMEHVPGALTLSIQGNRAVVDYQNEFGSDILNPRCESRIGELKSVRVNENDAGEYDLSSAVFAFNPNKCYPSIEGVELVLRFSPKGSNMRLSTSIVKSIEWDRHCRIDPGNPVRGVPPRQICDPEPVTEYLTGKFVR